MKSKKIYLVRHGQTDYNMKGVVQGSGVNSSINKTGKLQSDAFYAAYRHIKFDSVYTSTLKRTQESVKKFIDIAPKHEALEGLDEISWGVQEGKEVTEESDKYYYGVLDEWRKGNTSLRIEKGESPEDVAARQEEALQHILSQEEEKTVLISHHGRAMRVLMCKLLNYPLKYMDFFDHTNLGLYVINYSGRMFSIERYNDQRHLEILEKL